MEFTVNGGNAGSETNIFKREENGILYAEIKADFKAEVIPESFSVSWKMPSADCYSVWSPLAEERHSIQPEWAPRETNSALASGMPLHQVLSLSGKNRACIAVSDVASPLKIKSGICEFDSKISFTVEFFTRLTAKRSKYKAVIRIDTRDIPYYDSIYGASDWFEKDCGYTSAYVPDIAKRPMNSLWYSMHHGLDPDEIVNQCRLSKPLGMDTVIIDDGWQMEEVESVSGCYSRCGDWKAAPDKMGDMRVLSDRIHKTGTKVMLWYSVPFIGVESENYARFKDMLLDASGDRHTYFALDPRYKEVRDFLTETYVNAVRSWDLDGLKLDFIDAFTLGGKSLEDDAGRDFLSLEEAIDALMSGITEKLTAVKPDIMIEFRQSYIGPAIRKYGNMMRVGDCPADAVKNRINTVNLRYTSGRTAVHSDMLMWDYGDTAQNAAVQLTSVLYSVPQISVLIDRLPEEHLKMLKYYLGFWNKYRDVLLDGRLTADNPEGNYSRASAVLGDKAVITLYTASYAACSAGETVVVNASVYGDIILGGCAGRAYRVTDCMGETLESGVFGGDINRLSVPVSGMVTVS